MEPFVCFREQDEMIRRLTRIAAFRPPIARRHVDFAAENRLHAVLPRVIVENHGREQVPVLGDRQGRHLQLRRLVEHLVDAAGAVEQRKLGMQVQVDEFRQVQFPTDTKDTKDTKVKPSRVRRDPWYVGRASFPLRAPGYRVPAITS